MRNAKRKPFWIIQELSKHLFIGVGAVGLTLIFFLVLPLMQRLTQRATLDVDVVSVDIFDEPPPPPPMETEPEPEPEPEEAPPELKPETPPLSLDELALALNPMPGESLFAAAFEKVSLTTGSSNSSTVEEFFSIAELDQKPRPIYQPGPALTKEIRKKAPGTVYIIFVVNQKGRVENPVVQESTGPVFEKAALKALRQWKFEPGKRNGQPVSFRMRVPFTFPKGKN